MATRKAPPKKGADGTATDAGGATTEVGGAVESSALISEVPIRPLEPEVEQVLTSKVIPDEDKIQLINCTLQRNTCMIPAGTKASSITVPPFGVTPPIPISWASRLVGDGGKTDRGYVKGKRLFARILIRKRAK